MEKSALIIVDVQNDFLPGGALAVREGNLIVPVINSLIDSGKFDRIVATQDWHPADHKSFAANHLNQKPGDVIDLNGLPQVLWPVHCVQETAGAAFSPLLHTSKFGRVIRKGMDSQIDSYSGFFDNGHTKATGIAEYLREQGVVDIYVVGLATDYCVKFTALDGVDLGFNVVLIEDACRGVELNPGDIAAALLEMKTKKVSIQRSYTLF